MTATSTTSILSRASGAEPRSRELLEDLIYELMALARSDDQMDRRGAARYPFFRPVILASADAELGPHHAFTRELSTTGVGLMHSVKLTPGLFSVTIVHDDGRRTTLPTELLWCRPCGAGWYLSGAKFLLPDSAGK